MSVGSNIKKRRFECGMTQQELADALGYRTRSTIAKIESGENDVSQSKLRKFAAVLNTTVEALLADGTEMPAVSTVSPEFLDPGRKKNIAVILAGGKSAMIRPNIPSQFLDVQGKPIIIYCMEAYQAHPAVDDIFVVCLKGWESIVTAYARQYGITKLRGIIPGGSSGILSLKNAVDHMTGQYHPEDLVIIQEATRPRITSETISRLLLACADKDSATICHSMNEYVQFSIGEDRPKYIDRSTTIALQSPEAHRLHLMNEVFALAERLEHPLTETCCTMLLYNLGYPINFIESAVNNIKITRQEDVAAFSVQVK